MSSWTSSCVLWVQVCSLSLKAFCGAHKFAFMLAWARLLYRYPYFTVALDCMVNGAHGGTH